MLPSGNQRFLEFRGKNGNPALKHICCWVPKANLLDRWQNRWHSNSVCQIQRWTNWSSNKWNAWCTATQLRGGRGQGRSSQLPAQHGAALTTGLHGSSTSTRQSAYKQIERCSKSFPWNLHHHSKYSLLSKNYNPIKSNWLTELKPGFLDICER